MKAENAEVFREAIENAGHAIYITETDGTIRYVNPAFEEITGYTAEEAIGQNPSLLKSGVHSASFYQELWQTIRGGDVWKNEIINQRKNGELYYADQTIAPVIDDSSEITHFIAINTEITDQKILEQQAQVLNRVLRHNLRNRLNVIDGLARQLLNDPDDAALRGQVRSIRQAVSGLLDLSEQSDRITTVLGGVESAKPRCVGSVIENECEAIAAQYPAASVNVDVPDAEWVVDTQIEYAIREVLTCTSAV